MPSETLAIVLGVLVLTLLSENGRRTTARSVLTGLLLVGVGLAHQVVLVSILPCVCYKAFRAWRTVNSKSALTIRGKLSTSPTFVGMEC